MTRGANPVRSSQVASERIPALAWPVLIGLVAAKLAVHVPGLYRYGYFRDELYFLDCGRHLAWGYVDHAPLVGLLAKIALWMGGSLPALRILPAVAGAGLVALTVIMARRLGGGPFAQGLAGLAVLSAPVMLMIDSIMSMNVLEPLFWLACVLVLIRIVQTGDSRLWLLFGLLAGAALENKHSTVFFGAAVAVAVVLTPLRRELRKPWIWLGAGLALLLFLPNLLWQVANNFPTIEDLQNVRATGKNVELAPLAFMLQQALMMHPVLLPVWLVGLWHFLAGGGRRYRFVAWIYLFLLGTFMVLHGKDYYLAPAYPMLLAGGAVAIEGLLRSVRRSTARRWARAAVLGVTAMGGLLLAPVALPWLPPEHYVAYRQWLGVEGEKTEVHHEGPLPQVFGDQHGWPELVAEVARIYHALPEDERARTGIFASNYGEAGAINLFGPELGLPRAICAHQTHSFWGPGGFNGDTLIWLQWRREWIERYCDTVEQVGEHHHPWGMAEENRPIYLCRQLRLPLDVIWPRLKHWN